MMNINDEMRKYSQIGKWQKGSERKVGSGKSKIESYRQNTSAAMKEERKEKSEA